MSAECVWWEYDHHPDRAVRLPVRTEEIFQDIEHGVLDIPAFLQDTRAVHGRLFSELITPGVEPYVAGSYRGEDFHCLRNLKVTIGMNPRVGTPPAEVGTFMQALEESILRTAQGSPDRSTKTIIMGFYNERREAP